MEDTTRALAILAVATLLLAPLMNGVLDEAAATADRLFLKNYDYEGEPPIAPPEGEPPEDLEAGDREPPEDLEGEGPGPNGAPSCEIEEERVVEWVHEPVEQDPITGLSSRTGPFTESIEVEDGHLGMGVGIQFENLRGRLSFVVYDEDDPDNVAYTGTWPGELGTSDTDGSTIRRGTGLTTGTWVVELDNAGGHYDRLYATVVLASCAGVPS